MRWVLPAHEQVVRTRCRCTKASRKWTTKSHPRSTGSMAGGIEAAARSSKGRSYDGRILRPKKPRRSVGVASEQASRPRQGQQACCTIYLRQSHSLSVKSLTSFDAVHCTNALIVLGLINFGVASAAVVCTSRLEFANQSTRRCCTGHVFIGTHVRDRTYGTDSEQRG